MPNGSAPPGSANWTTFHHDRARSGYDSNEGLFSSLGAGWTNTALVGDIYAVPLVYGSTVYIVTEDNYLYALKDSTGAVLWYRNLAAPMNAGSLPCGNISPHVGITSTPVIDAGLNRIYMVGMVSTGHYVIEPTSASALFRRLRLGFSLKTRSLSDVHAAARVDRLAAGGPDGARAVGLEPVQHCAICLTRAEDDAVVHAWKVSRIALGRFRRSARNCPRGYRRNCASAAQQRAGRYRLQRLLPRRL